MNTEIYNAHDHLVTIQTKQGLKPYYPACWRLYELSIRFANANFKSEIVHMDLEHDFVIVKAYLFLGTDYATSEKRAEAFKQGKLSMLDKVETAAKARAARDFGISTELALDMEDATVDETEPVQQQPQQQQQQRQPAPAPAQTQQQQQRKYASNGLTLGKLKHRAQDTGWARDKAGWDIRIAGIFGGTVPEDEELAKPESLALINFHLEQFAQAAPAA